MGQKFTLQLPPMGQGTVLRDDPRGMVKGKRVAVFIGLHDAGVIRGRADMRQHRMGLQAGDQGLGIVVVKGRFGSVIKQRGGGFQQMRAPGGEAPTGQLQAGVKFRIKALIQQAVLRRKEQRLDWQFRSDIGEEAAHGFPYS